MWRVLRRSTGSLVGGKQWLNASIIHLNYFCSLVSGSELGPGLSGNGERHHWESESCLRKHHSIFILHIFIINIHIVCSFIPRFPSEFMNFINITFRWRQCFHTLSSLSFLFGPSLWEEWRMASPICSHQRWQFWDIFWALKHSRCLSFLSSSTPRSGWRLGRRSSSPWASHLAASSPTAPTTLSTTTASSENSAIFKTRHSPQES